MSAREISNEKQEQAKQLAARLTEVLQNLDEHIFSLQKCSSEDFQLFSKKFKVHVSEINKITENTKEIFSLCNEQNNKAIANDIKLISDKLDAYSHLINAYYHLWNDYFESPGDENNDLFFALNNYKQNLNTYKLLLTNSKVRQGSVDSEHAAKQQAFEKKINEFLNKISGYTSNLKGFIDRTNQLHNILIDYNQEKLELANYLEQINQKVNEIPALIEKQSHFKKITGESTEHISNIITNLQYDDIIRQKIEHIQKIQKDIIIDLDHKNASKNTENKDSSNSEGQLMHVIDILNLLAAQLLHTNKEYQSAIKTLSSKFHTLSKTVEEITKTGFAFINHSENQSTYLVNIIETLNKAIHYYSNFFEISEHISSLIDLCNEIIESSESFKIELHAFHEFYENESPHILQTTEQNGISALNNIKSLDKVIKKDQEEIEHALSAYIERQLDFKGKLSHKNIIELNQQQEIILNSIKQEIKLLEDKNYSVHVLLQDNKNTCNSISQTIQHTIDNVQYYTFFEQVIDEIIQNVETVNQDLVRYPDLIPGETKKNIEHFKSFYTMKSEHDIHEKLLNKLNIDDSEEKPEDDENLELF
jgi:hypothetical protein